MHCHARIEQHWQGRNTCSWTLTHVLIDTLSVMQDMDGSKEEVAPLIQQLLQDKAVLLQECFGIQVDAEGHLAALPQLIEGHCPDLDRLPHFVLQLARDVDWEDEKQCFKGLAQVKCLWQ